MLSTPTTEYYDDDAPTTMNHIMETTTTPSPLTTLATVLLGLGDDTPFKTATTTIAEKTMLLNPTNTPYQREHLEHNKITFEIPSHRDLEHIDSMHNFNTLLKRIGNAVTTTYDASQFNGDNHHQHQSQHQQQQAQQHLLTTAEISKSVVLDLADLKANGADDGFGFGFGLDRFFAGADMHSIINYLWIGVVTSLVILSVIFIVFSCYFYRKFREWKKCNKDIRAHLNGSCNNNNDEILYNHGNGMLGTTTRTYLGGSDRATYYKIESPPCYTIATGLPSYDEALLHHPLQHYRYHQHHNHHEQQQHEQQNYYDCAFKYMYTTPVAIHQHQHQNHHHQQQQQAQQQNINITDVHQFNRNSKKAPTETDVDSKMLQYCCTTYNVEHKNSKITRSNKQQQQQQKQQQQQHIKVSTLLLEQSLPPAYNMTANMANMASMAGMLNPNDMESTPMLLNNEKIDSKINICIPDEMQSERNESNIGEKAPEGNNELQYVEATISTNSLSTIYSHQTIEPDVGGYFNKVDVDNGDDDDEDVIVIVA